ncbi:MAG TPA: hypothetical protein VMV19_18240 [Xanthobacteraceae bacterium]|nr:hypothetical protein [Xanthobacteraceae bacterium]
MARARPRIFPVALSVQQAVEAFGPSVKHALKNGVLPSYRSPKNQGVRRVRILVSDLELWCRLYWQDTRIKGNAHG